MDLFSLIAYVITGILAGFLGGLLGISGGLITVPCLIFIFQALNFPSSIIAHLAIGTSLASMVFTSLSATWYFQKRENVVWDLVIKMGFGILIGSIVGSLIAHVTSSSILQKIFGTFACLLSIYFFWAKKNHLTSSYPPSATLWNVLGFFVSALASILGVGGGVITVPLLCGFGVAEKKAIGTSTATGLCISFLGAIAYLYFGMQAISFPNTVGYLYIPAFIVLGFTTFLVAPLGAKLAHHLHSTLLRKLFAIVLFISGVLLLR